MVKRRNLASNSDPFVQMGFKLKELRQLNGLSISELAETVDLSEKSISNYENGYNRITIETIVTIYQQKALGERELEELLEIFIVDIFK